MRTTLHQPGPLARPRRRGVGRGLADVAAVVIYPALALLVLLVLAVGVVALVGGAS